MEEKDSAPLITSKEAKLSHEDDFLPARVWVPKSIWAGIVAVALWIFNFVLDLFKALWHACLIVYRACTKGVLSLWAALRRLGHKFRFNDWSGRLSFVLFGTSHFAHKRYANGIISLVFEVGYIVLFALFGLPSIGQLGNLGDIKEAGDVCDDLGICETKPADNSLLIIVYGVLWIISIFLFLYMWKRSIETGYRNYRIAHYNEFKRRSEAARPYSDIIDKDIAKNDLYSAKKKELKARYADVYVALDAKPIDSEGTLPNKEDIAYYHYILDTTIEYRLSFQKRIKALDLKREGKLAKVEKVQKDEKVLQKLALLDKEAAEARNAFYAKREEASKLGADIKNNPDLAKELSALKLKKLHAEDRLANASLKQEKRLAKAQEELRLLDVKREDMVKNDLPFSTIDSVENQSSYGKFNVYYRTIADLDRDIAFYAHFGEIAKAYDEGLASYQKANEENLAKRKDLENEHKQKVEAIEEQYRGIAERRASIEGLAKLEKDKLAETLQSLKADSALSSEVRKAKMLEAKSLCEYNLKTIKGKVLALPTKKEVATSHKEDLKNVDQAFKRDYKGLKVDYTAETYALYMATNLMVVNYGFEYAYAEKMAKDSLGKKLLSEEVVTAKLHEKEEAKKEYLEKVPSKFDGSPKTFREQIRSMFDENFHITLLALPILGVIFFTVMPLALSILVAFTNYDVHHTPPSSGFSWAGMLNFMSIFVGGGNYDNLGAALGETIVWTFAWAVIATFSNYFLGIIYALLINKDGIRLKKMWRFIFMLSIAIPQFISLIAMSNLLKDNGAIGKLWYELFGNYLGFSESTKNNALNTKIIIILVNIWVGIPYTILQTTGILMNIPRDLYESSKIDGASAFTQFTKITLPYIFFVTGPALIQNFIGNVNNFGVIYFLTQGNPINNSVIGGQLGYTDLMITYLYKLVTSPNNANYGLASAIGIIVFVICSFVSVIMYNRSSAVSREDQFQ